MTKEIFSNHIGNSSELTVLADIKKGFVPVMEPLTYSARLRLHLRMLSALRRNGLETDRGGVYVGPVDNLRTLQFVRWTLVENDTKMLLSVNFDQALEPYIRRIVDIAGPLLDTILCHCENFANFSSDQGYEKFLSYATRYQVPVELFAAAAPDVSVDDIDYFLNFDKMLRSGENGADVDNWQPAVRMPTPEDRLAYASKYQRLALLDQSIGILRTMQENADRFPDTDHEGVLTRDDLLYHNLARKLVPGFWESLQKGLLRSDLKDHPVVKGDWTVPPVEALTQVLCGAAKQMPNNRQLVRMCELFSQNQQPLLWFANAPAPRAKVHPVAPAPGRIQAGLLRAEHPIDGVTIPDTRVIASHSCMLLLRVDVPAQGGLFLSDMIRLLWPDTEQRPKTAPEGQLFYNLSVTHNGLKALCIPEDVRCGFPHAFREGMDRRAGLLGDIDINHPREWTWPKGNWPLARNGAKPRPVAPSSIDVIVQIHAALPDAPVAPEFDAQHPLLPEVDAIAQMAEARQVVLLAVEAMQRRENRDNVFQGHLGFADGTSQPHFGGDVTDPDYREPGDLLVGRPRGLDAPDEQIDPPHPALQNGTFQVIRKTRIDVHAFDDAAAGFTTKANGVDADLVKAKMVGRNADGTSLGTVDGSYGHDEKGTETPLQSHVRRANPRFEGRQARENARILRRGYSYGPYIEDAPDDDVDRGQVFIAYNASISEQFEVVQRWISGGNSARISSWHGDPLLAPKRPQSLRNFRFLHDKHLVNVNLSDTPIATLQWGLYAFTPSCEGLRELSNLADQRHRQYLSEAAYPARLSPPPKEAEAELWKLFLENADDETRDRREAFWNDVRTGGGTMDTGYGRLVGSRNGIEDVLNDDGSTYSTRTYLRRMMDTVGPQYLGYDKGPDHDAESQVMNDFLATLDDRAMFDETRAVADAKLDALAQQTQSKEDDGHNDQTSVKELGRRFVSEMFILDTIAELCVSWFGTPRHGLLIGGPEQPNDPMPHCPRDVLPASFYVFGAHPTDHLTNYAKDRVPRFLRVISDYVISGQAGTTGDLLAFMRDVQAADKTGRWTDQKVAEFVTGACFGFAGPVSGSFRSVLYDWIKEEKLWRLHHRYHARLDAKDGNPFDAATHVLRPAILDSMAKRPVPDILYRTISTGKDDGTICAFSLRSAIADDGDPEMFLFGGDYIADPDAGPLHKCPGKAMAMQVLAGSFAALFAYHKIRPEGPLSMWLSERPA